MTAPALHRTRGGNFLAIFDFMAEYDDILHHLQNGKCNAHSTYTTTTDCICIIGDEVIDTYGNQEILAICLHFLDEKHNIQEIFFDFIQ